MRIISDEQSSMKVKTETLDDIWVLYGIIEKDDVVSGDTIRKVKIGDSQTDRNVKIAKKHMFLQIKVEKTDFETSQLRVTGPIIKGPDDVALGEYHSFTIDDKTQITIEKTFLQYQKDQLAESTKPSKSTFITLFDREKALFYLFSKQGIQKIAELNGTVAKKGEPKSQSEDFFATLTTQINTYLEKYKPDTVVMGCSHFWAPSVSIPKAIYIESDSLNIQDVVKSPEFGKLAKNENSAKQIQLFETIKSHLATDNLVTYGLAQVKAAAQMGAVSEILITTNYIAKCREQETFFQVEQMLRTIDSQKGNVHIVEKTVSVHKDIDALGGIIALLRYEIE